MKIGLIGLGRLGAALARGLDRAGGFEIHGCNRSPQKAYDLAAQVASLEVRGAAAEVLETCGTVFLWTNEEDARHILEDNEPLITARQPLLVSCIPGVPLAMYTGRWAEALPNICMAAGRGVTLLHCPATLAPSDRLLLLHILQAVGEVHEVDPQDMTYYSALCSCGPALYATMLEVLADTLAKRRGYDREFCRRLARETVAGTAALEEYDGIGACEIVRRVAHPGGPSEAGVRYLERVLPDLFPGMLREMKKW